MQMLKDTKNPQIRDHKSGPIGTPLRLVSVQMKDGVARRSILTIADLHMKHAKVHWKEATSVKV